MKSEIKMPRDRDRELKLPKKSREFSRNETLAGYCDLGDDDSCSAEKERLQCAYLGRVKVKRESEK